MIRLTSVIHDTKTNSVEATWVDADDVQIKCHSYADVQMDMFRDDALAMGTPLTDYEAMIADVESKIVPYVPPPTPIPSSVSMRQARLALHFAGMLTSVEATIAGMSEPDKTVAQITWEFAQTVEREFGMVPALAAAMGMTDAQIDELFIAASQL